MNNVITALIVSLLIIFSTKDNDTTSGGSGTPTPPAPKIVNHLNIEHGTK